MLEYISAHLVEMTTFVKSYWIVTAGYMKDLARLENEKNIRPSPEIDAFMKVYIWFPWIRCLLAQFSTSIPIISDCISSAQASSVGGKRHSISTEYVLKVLGLDICADTFVGNDMLRGVSGGQRKRVTTGIFSSVHIYRTLCHADRNLHTWFIIWRLF